MMITYTLLVLRCLSQLACIIALLALLGSQSVLWTPSSSAEGYSKITYQLRSGAFWTLLWSSVWMVGIEIIGYSRWNYNWVENIVQKVKTVAPKAKSHLKKIFCKRIDSSAALVQKLEWDLDESRNRVKVLESLAVQAGLSAKPPKSMTVLEMWDLCERLARACKTRFHCTLDTVVMITTKPRDNNPESGIEMERVDQARFEASSFLKQFCDTMDGIHDDLVNQHGNVCLLDGRYARRGVS